MKTTLLILLGCIAMAKCTDFDNFMESRNKINQYLSWPSTETISVQVGMFVQRMRNFCEKNQEFQIDMFLRQNWTDKRLAHTSTKPIKFREEGLQVIWTPDTFLPWDHVGKVNQMMTPNIMVKIRSDGSVLWSSKISTNIPCKDIEGTKKMECELRLQSYAFNMEEIDYWWKTESQKELPWPMKDFKLINIERTYVLSNYTVGTYKTLKAIFTVEKQL